MKEPTPTPFPTNSEKSLADHLAALRAHLGLRRSRLEITPGLYALGSPGPQSPVVVTASYRPSFNAVRTALAGTDAYILVLDTKGINVWCAAGKGTFGTDELVRRLAEARLDRLVRHRRIVLPQLGAPGVAAHEVKKRSGFRVRYGPVRAADLPHYLETGAVTPEMRRVTFSLPERASQSLVDLAQTLPLVLVISLLIYLVGGLRPALTVPAAAFTGMVLFPLLLPWIPTPNFSTKGFFLGALAAIPFALATLFWDVSTPHWQRAMAAAAYLLTVPALTAYVALQFTGSTTFTSRSGVRREIQTYIPVMARLFVPGALLASALAIMDAVGV